MGPIPELEQVYQEISAFLEAAREPVLLEPGAEQFRLAPESFQIEWLGGRLMIQVWDEKRNVARRITGVRNRRPGMLDLIVERFGKRNGEMALIDRARARPDLGRRGARTVFREQFRRFLYRQFSGWTLAELSSEPNLEESLSPAYSRALLKKGGDAWAAIGAPNDAAAAHGALTFGLIWLDYLRRRERRLNVGGLAIFLPEAHARPTCLRLPFLNPRAAQFLPFSYSDEGLEQRLDPRDFGNVDTKLEPWPAVALAEPAAEWVERLALLPTVERVPRGDGSLSLRVRGLEFARAAESTLHYGVKQKRRFQGSSLESIERMAREIGRLRSHSAPARDHPLYRLQPESWLESVVRPNLEQLDSQLLPGPIYGQAPAIAAGDRGIIDLLAADRDGRLVVIELKASEDIHLPLQALDYWIRVKWHLARGEFTARGYFPGIALSGAAWPRILLVAPALHFHPKTEAILRYFAPGIDVERIGLSPEWRQGIDIMFRLRGATGAGPRPALSYS